MYWLLVAEYVPKYYGNGDSSNYRTVKWTVNPFETFQDAHNHFIEICNGVNYLCYEDKDSIEKFLLNGGILGDDDYRIEIVKGKWAEFIQLEDGKEALTIEEIKKNKNNAEYWVSYWSSIGKPVPIEI